MNIIKILVSLSFWLWLPISPTYCIIIQWWHITILLSSMYNIRKFSVRGLSGWIRWKPPEWFQNFHMESMKNSNPEAIFINCEKSNRTVDENLLKSIEKHEKLFIFRKFGHWARIMANSDFHCLSFLQVSEEIIPFREPLLLCLEKFSLQILWKKGTRKETNVKSEFQYLGKNLL